MTTSNRVLVYGVAITGEAVLRALLRRGFDVIAADDAVTDTKRSLVENLGVELVDAPDQATIERLVGDVAFVAPAPGVPETHAVVQSAQALGTPLRTELDLAAEWEHDRAGGPRPMLAVTGTDGKTTTTLMADAMLRAAGVRSAAVGNTEIPLVAVLDDDALDAFVVECSSFRLSWTTRFRPKAGVWLNLAPDHQNWHVDMASYVAAKARMWAFQGPGDVAIGFADDPIVMAELQRAPGRTTTFGLHNAQYHLAGDVLVGPRGAIAPVAGMRRRLPHDITNALAAAALVIESGLASADAVAAALATFVGPPHRIEPIGEAEGVTWYNDSKATTPHAALTAIRAFDSLVLIAGGRNKGLDLGELASEPQRLRGVVAIGEAAPLIAAVFAGVCPVVTATSMRDAVERAGELAEPGDAVVLSPACASFDWYPDGGYPARGDDFRALVRAHLDQSTVGAG